MKTISVVYEINRCGDCPFCKKSKNCYPDGQFCIQIGEYVDKNKMSNKCLLIDWGMYSSKKLEQTENEKSS